MNKKDKDNSLNRNLNRNIPVSPQWVKKINEEITLEAESDPFRTLKAMMKKHCGVSEEQAEANIDRMLSNVNFEEE